MYHGLCYITCGVMDKSSGLEHWVICCSNAKYDINIHTSLDIEREKVRKNTQCFGGTVPLFFFSSRLALRSCKAENFLFSFLVSSMIFLLSLLLSLTLTIDRAAVVGSVTVFDLCLWAFLAFFNFCSISNL